MGLYVNTGVEKFNRVLRSKIYVDKTGLLEYMNSVIDTESGFICISRPRRFGKSITAAMLSAYYGKGCDSSAIFDDKKIAQSEDYRKYINQYNVIDVDMNVFLCRTDASTGKSITVSAAISLFQREVVKEIREIYPDCFPENEMDLPSAMAAVYAKTGTKFVVIIDEWDAVFRESPRHEEGQKQYLELLRGLFKNATSKEFLALGYLTGILPIKKYGTQSALNNFDEFTMLNPMCFSEYVGFTEDEVKALCSRYQMSFEETKHWYDGYSFRRTRHVYNPNSVVKAMTFGEYNNYWTRTETYETLKNYISMNFDGLKDDVIEMLAGGRCKINPDRFQNDMVTFKSKDDVMALLIHLGYLAYDYDRHEVYIPNEEVRSEFRNAVEGNEWKTVVNAIEASEQLLPATWKLEEEKVAEAVERVHRENTSIIKYNDENSLSCVITLAYYCAMEGYTLIRELPAGEGFADIAFLPRKHTDRPAMIIELKYDKSADTAISQIKNRQYAGVLEEYSGNILLVGISYDSKTKKHTCRIEVVENDGNYKKVVG